jgi:predicted nuclease of predicted toxin-antitoxin system
MTSPAGRPMRVYLDECVDVLVGQLLSSRGFDCLTAVEAGHLQWSDEEHLQFATNDSRILITHNRVDFERLSITWWAQQKEHAGIILANPTC